MGGEEVIFKYPNKQGRCKPCHKNCTQGSEPELSLREFIFFECAFISNSPLFCALRLDVTVQRLETALSHLVTFRGKLLHLFFRL